MGKYYVRVCYRNGIAKEENKVFEVHKLCDCAWCREKYLGRTRVNKITITAECEDEIEKKVERFLDGWKCANGEKDLPIVFIKANQI